MAPVIYLLCALTCLACFALLLRAWHSTRKRLLFWSALCFAGLSLNNLLLVADKLVLQDLNLTTLRLATAFVAMLLLVYGLVGGEE